jgi:hypothetical protein
VKSLNLQMAVVTRGAPERATPEGAIASSGQAAEHPQGLLETQVRELAGPESGLQARTSCGQRGHQIAQLSVPPQA